MKTPLYIGIAWRLILLFTVAMLATFIPENAREFFGDVPCLIEDRHHPNTTCTSCCGEVDVLWNWGARHYWYFWLMVLLFLLSLINLILTAVKLVTKYHPEIKQH